MPYAKRLGAPTNKKKIEKAFGEIYLCTKIEIHLNVNNTK